MVQRTIEGQLQQGDVVFQRVEMIPADAQPAEGCTFAEGEGHHLHRAAMAADVTLYAKDGVRYARVHRETIVEHVTPDGRHGEHDPITLPAGDYSFGQVVEYDYLTEMVHRVVD